MITDLNNNQPLVNFINGVNDLLKDYWTKNQFDFNDPPVVMVENVGRRYAKLAVYEKTPYKTGPLVANRVYCFYDLTNGDLLKGSWKAPVANGVRGNVNEPNVLNKFDWHGPRYLR